MVDSVQGDGDAVGFSSRARGDFSAPATFQLLHLASHAKGTDRLDEPIVVEVEPAEQTSYPVRHLVRISAFAMINVLSYRPPTPALYR